jgi:hypothetical protein
MEKISSEEVEIDLKHVLFMLMEPFKNLYY